MNGSRPKLRRLLADPKVTTVVVEHRDRLARMNAELVEAALSAHGRRLVAGIPTARFRDRLVQMSTNKGLAVVAVDPAYTSCWGAEHWLGTLKKISPAASGHHAAALVIGRRGLGQRARRRERCDRTQPADRERRAADSTVWPMPAGQPAGLSGQRTRELRSPKARGRPHPRQRTQPADREPRGDQVAHDRSGPPTTRNSVPLSV
ncbi:MAG: hypothetical protein ACYCYB_09685 [Candidatus Dormibacteria bacterium]